MDKRGEIMNRWVRVFEQKTPEAKLIVLDRIKGDIIEDVSYLMMDLKNAEDNLAKSISQVSPEFGAVVISDNGVLKYRINGRFIDVKTIVDGLRQLTVLCNMESLAKRVGDKVDLEELREAFDDKL